ncbi:TPA: hypothetical protein ACG3KP_004022, partial [Clostridioides difficile]
IREVRLYKTDYSRNILLAFFILALFSTAALTAFYLHPMSDYNIYFRIGLLLFIVMLSCFSFHKVYLLSQEQEQIQFYRQLAYTDTMTKALFNAKNHEGNVDRTCYHTKLVIP